MYNGIREKRYAYQLDENQPHPAPENIILEADHVRSPWQSWGNLHKSANRRLFGLSDDGDVPVDLGTFTAPAIEDVSEIATDAGVYVDPSTSQSFNQTPGGGYVQTSPSTQSSGIFGTLLGQVGQLVGLKSGGIIMNPRPGQLVNKQTASFSQSTSTRNMLMIGAGLLALAFILKKK